MSEQTSIPGPREVFERMRQQWLGNTTDHVDDQFADDVVIELPFASPGRPRRFEGRQQFLDFTAPERAAFPVRFDDVRNVVVHETTDPEVIVVEYELAGTHTTTGRRGAAPFVGVLRVRNGQAVLWREYQNVLAIAEATGQLPALLAAATAHVPGE